jgi:dimethylargininase
MFRHAIVRKPGIDCAQGLTTVGLGPPDYHKLCKQHDAYVKVLDSLGLEIYALEALPGYPDAYFVEDVAIITPKVAVITNPGAPARQGEEDGIEDLLSDFMETIRIQPPGTVEGGDVLMVGNHFFVGISDRTNEEGARQLGTILENHGHTWRPVAVGAGLHLKSSINYAGGNRLIVTQDFAGREEIEGYEQFVLDADEAYAANTLLVNDTLIMPAGYPRTGAKLGEFGLDIIEIDVSEIRKMDGGLTCMSLRF